MSIYDEVKNLEKLQIKYKEKKEQETKKESSSFIKYLQKTGNIIKIILHLLFGLILLFFFIYSMFKENIKLTQIISDIFFVLVYIIYFIYNLKNLKSDFLLNSNELNKEVLKHLGYKNNSDYIEIPKFHTITSIKNGSIKNNTYEITSIGESAFKDYKAVRKIIIPNSVTKIKKMAFYECPSLNEIIIPESVTEIEEDVFVRCPALISLTIPDSVVKIGKFAFNGLDNLEYLSLPKHLKSNIDNIFLDNVKNVVYRELGELKIKKEAKNIEIPNFLLKIEDFAFCDYSSLTEIIIPEGVVEIGNNVFIGCSNLNSITVPDSVFKIGKFAFNGLDNLKYLILPPFFKDNIDYAILDNVENVIYRKS